MSIESHRIPLLKDQHNHPLLYAALNEGDDLARNPPKNSGEAIARITAHAQRGSTSRWSIAYRWNSGICPIPQGTFDNLPPLAVINLSLHGFIVNTSGRDLMQRFDPIVAANLDDQDWIERNLRRVLNVFASDGASADRLGRYLALLLKQAGVYHIEEMLLVDESEIRHFEDAGLINRTKFWAAPEHYDRLDSDFQKKIYSIKLFTDGAFGASTAALHQPYNRSSNTGILLYSQNELETLIRRFPGAGMPMAIHAIGDAAIDQVVSAVHAVGRPTDGELRVEHAQLISERTASRAKELGIRLSMQPNFSQDSIDYSDRLPQELLERNNPFRMLIDKGGYRPGSDLLFGSDGMPHGFREGLRCALFPPCEGQKLTIDEFVAGYCLADFRPGYIDVKVDRDNRAVTGEVVVN